MSFSKKVVDKFNELFNLEPTVFIAPGRINIIGEHTDYNGGFVMPAAIDKHFIFATSKRTDDRFCVHAIDLNEQVTFSITDSSTPFLWATYLLGVACSIKKLHKTFNGLNLVFASNIPMGGGMSSSAALCSGVGFALNELYQLGLSKIELAQIAQLAERDYAGANVGIMDPFASLHGKKNSLLFLDCRSLEFEYVPFKSEGHELLLIDTNVKHSLASSAYNKRRQACEEGVAAIQKDIPQVNSLRDVSRNLLAKYTTTLGADVFNKCSYVIAEIERTQQAAHLLKMGDLPALGTLMYQTHWGLSQLYEVSCPELDFLVAMAEKNKPLFLGSRMMGGGFGGCTINLLSKELTPSTLNEIKTTYYSQFNIEPKFYSVVLADGVKGYEDKVT
jgi:galactokinase